MTTNSFRPNLESLDGRIVPAAFPTLYQVGGLAYPGPAASYAAQVEANQRLNQLHRAQLAQVATAYQPAALQRAGLEPGLAWALSDAARRAAAAPSLLDAKPPSVAEFNAAIGRLRAGANNVGYVLSSAGYRRDLMIVGGYGDLTKMSAYQLGQAALRDPLIGLLSGNLTAQTTIRYLDRFYTNGSATGMNYYGAMGAVGLGQTGAAAALGQLMAIGGSGYTSRPPGTGTGSPFMDALLAWQPSGVRV